VAAVSTLKPDIVVMDISMPDMTGLDATRAILKANPRVEVLMLSVHDSEQMVHDVVAAGARGYILKRDAGNELIAALEAVGQHKLYFTAKVSEVILQGFLRNGEKSETAEAPFSRLSSREREIVKLVAEGKANKEIAHVLGISIKTVETHRANIMEKLDLHSVTDLVRYAIRNNLVEC
jgi:DNA-binding NarL/FixJ family response regulator